jgi:hypothetical protein
VRSPLIAAVLLASLPAAAAEVVWLSPPTDADAARVAALARATRAPLTVEDLRAAPTAASPADEAAWRTLDATLAEVRSFETRLDGELLIARDLGPAIDAITLVRSPADRDRLRRALAYQGFAVHRLGAGDLSLAEIEPFIQLFDGVPFIRPWVDAAALDPTYAITAYDIAEAPQRIAYSEAARGLGGLLPGTVRADSLPAGAELWVDGALVAPGPGGVVRLPVGRHRAHLIEGGLITARWTLDLEPGATIALEPPLPADTLRLGLADLAEGPTPSALVAAVTALGGEVWVADGAGARLRAYRVTPAQVAPVDVREPRDASDAPARLSVAGQVGGGWLWSGDFLASHPGAPATYGTVNAIQPELGVEIGWRDGLFAADAGVSAWIPLGAQHTARTGTSEIRVRAAPTLAVGTPWARATVGFVFPHHPIVGLRAELPLPGETYAIRAEGRLGPSLTFGSTGDRWTSQPLRSAGLSLVARRGLR